MIAFNAKSYRDVADKLDRLSDYLLGHRKGDTDLAARLKGLAAEIRRDITMYDAGDSIDEVVHVIHQMQRAG